jgi:hypothetical protein
MEIQIPNGITEEQVKEWLAVLVERKVNQELNNNAEVKLATEKAKTDIDTYRKSIGLAPKFEEKVIPKEE